MDQPFSPADYERTERLRAWWDGLSSRRGRWIARNSYYYEQLYNFLNALLLPKASVLEIGCGTGYLLHKLKGAAKTGVDLSPLNIEQAKRRDPSVTWRCLNAEEGPLGGPYDFIILSDVLNELTDIWRALRKTRKACDPGSRVIITIFNPLWQPFFKLGELLRMRMPHLQQNWFDKEDLRQLLEVNNMEVVREGPCVLLPLYIPLVSRLVNRYLSHLPVFRRLCCTRFVIARPVPAPDDERTVSATITSCTVVVPCLNEKDNIRPIIERVPVMGEWTELLFIDGHSTDGTWETLEREIAAYKGPLRLTAMRQKGVKGKGQAVREAFEAAAGDALVILDADITVQPEDLPKFFTALSENHAEFVNGSRLVYPREQGAMRFLNVLGNRFFGFWLSGIISRRLLDTLCGTKALSRLSYYKIRDNRDFFGDFDPFGDFDLIFGAARLGLKMTEIPVRYYSRVYGETKIRRFFHGWLLFRMCFFAMRKFH